MEIESERMAITHGDKSWGKKQNCYNGKDHHNFVQLSALLGFFYRLGIKELFPFRLAQFFPDGRVDQHHP